ncbi:MAG TPA: type II toxin-antitoxin system death-on-curing family toxin [Solirubrobacterales bacterium]|nr:type II toxin-antitoxin system death-on-curing family toxin [Solirubrobacterales bacterium]
MEENEPVYIELADALELYAAIIDGTTAQAVDQLRDQAGLESALGRPRNYAHYQEADLALQAAALAHGVAESQAFIDGNKRLALVSMLTFLEVNGYQVNATDPELADWITGLSASTTPKQLAGVIRSRLRAVE